jgi:acyl-CoA dehydrogenase
LHEKFLPELLPGKKRACIAITEPSAGSDVANIATTAVKTPDGKHYIINGEKVTFPVGRCDMWLMCSRNGSPMVSGPIMRPWPSARVALELQA